MVRLLREGGVDLKYLSASSSGRLHRDLSRERPDRAKFRASCSTIVACANMSFIVRLGE
jgi:hypothetical protein